MKILVLSNTPWSNDNSFGNSFSNIFEGIEDVKFANIYCRYGCPNNQFDMKYFQITEKSLIRNLKNKKQPSGKEVFGDEKDADIPETNAIVGMNSARKMRWQIMFWGRDLVWKIGKWKSPQLIKFLDEFEPDVIFQPVYYSNYINDIALFVKEYTGVPMLGYISDDNYTLRQFRLSPLYWIDRLWKRKKVKAIIEKCEVLYVISQIQKEEYEKIFSIPCKVLTKCGDFEMKAPKWQGAQGRIKMLYAGNLGAGRWKSLALIADAVARLNEEGVEIYLDIYSATPQTEAMKKALNVKGSRLNGPITSDIVQQLQKKADIVIHVEGLTLKSRMEVHQSFSTKIVDYFALGKCIFAVGTMDEASIKHLADNAAAIVAEDRDSVYVKLKLLVRNPKLITEYGARAYACGKKHHSKKEMQSMLINDLKGVVDKNK